MEQVRVPRVWATFSVVISGIFWPKVREPCRKKRELAKPRKFIVKVKQQNGPPHELPEQHNTQHGAGAGAARQGQAQHSNINASSDGSNNNNSGNCCFGRRRSQTRLPYWPSPTTISGRGRGSEGKVGGEREREREGKAEGGTERVKVEVR